MRLVHFKQALLRIARQCLRPLLLRKRSLMRGTETERKALISLVESLPTDKPMVMIEGTIDTFLERYPNVAIDFAYVDGCHTYEAVKHDLQCIMSACPPRVAIGGHDYEWEGVRNAIEECLGKPDNVFPDTSWIKYHPVM